MGAWFFFFCSSGMAEMKSPLCFLRIINAGPVLAALVVSLPVHRGSMILKYWQISCF